MTNGTATALTVDHGGDAHPRQDPRETGPIHRLVHFRNGLPGFPECRQFLLRSTDRHGIYWLQSADHDALAFVLADPFLFVKDFAVDLADADVAELDPTASSDIAVLAIVTLPRSREQPCTLNLQGPLTINLRNGRARQVVLPESDFGLHHPVDLTRPVAGH